MRHLLLACLDVALCRPAAAASRFVEDPYPSTYRPLASRRC